MKDRRDAKLKSKQYMALRLYFEASMTPKQIGKKIKEPNTFVHRTVSDFKSKMKKLDAKIKDDSQKKV